MANIGEILGKRFKSLRVEKKVSHIEIAEAAGLKPISVTRFEDGETFPRPDNFNVMLQRLGLDAETFLNLDRIEMDKIEKADLLISLFGRLPGLKNNQLRFILDTINRDYFAYISALGAEQAESIASEIIGKHRNNK